MKDYTLPYDSAGQTADALPNVFGGRQPIALDAGRVTSALAGKRVMITGAGGSIGSALSRAVLDFVPQSLVLLDNSEHNLFTVGRSLAGAAADTRLVPVLGDIEDGPLLEELFGSFAPEVIFHAAAYKHVSLLEGQPAAAVRNNVCGTHTLLSNALRQGARKVVLLSTDKAVNPVSILGASKRVAELMAASLDTARTRTTSVRFGNVLWSRGSFLPLVAEQLNQRSAVTVTHPSATRYFLSMQEAVNLLLDAAWLGAGADVLVPELGPPVGVLGIAEALIRRAGLEPYEGLPVVFTGLRPGEKLHEELSSGDEALEPTQARRVFRIKPPRMTADEVEDLVSALRRHGAWRDSTELIETIRRAVPEYRPGFVRPAV
jgi:FlaA1/EpsC-like NDP-sugar epimerase